MNCIPSTVICALIKVGTSGVLAPIWLGSIRQRLC